jgi:hypothetical protein
MRWLEEEMEGQSRSWLRDRVGDDGPALDEACGLIQESIVASAPLRAALVRVFGFFQGVYVQDLVDANRLADRADEAHARDSSLRGFIAGYDEAVSMLTDPDAIRGIREFLNRKD